MNVLCSAKACPVILSSTCVFYEGENLVYSGINTNDSIQLAIQKLDEALASDVFTINVVAPLQSTGGVAPTLSITQSSSSIDGYLSSTDWNIFNNKQNTVSLTTTGSSGPSTFNSTTGALNIPDYSGSFSGFVPIGRLLTINGVAQDLSADRTWTIDTLYNANGALTSNRTVNAGSGNYTLTLNPKTFFDNGATFNATTGNVGTFINTHNYSTISTQLYFYPNSGTNVAQTLNIVPRGTGFNSVFKAQFSVYNNDVIANGMANAEFVTFRAAGSLFTFASGKFGTGVIRPLMFSAGYATDSSTNINQLYLSTAGNVLIGTATDSALAKFQVSGAIQQSSVVSAMLKANSNGVLVNAIANTDYLPVNNPIATGQFQLWGTGVTSYTPYINTLGAFVSDVNDYQLFYIQNKNSGSDASADFVAYNDVSAVDSFFIDMGINSSNYSSVIYPIFPANSGYVFTGGGTGSLQPSHLYMGTSTPSSDVVLFAGGINPSDIVLTVTGAGKNVVIGTGLASDTGEKVQIAGNVKVDGGDVRITGGGAYADSNMLGDPHQLTTKEYVDNQVAAGLHVHQPVRVETSSALTATYTQGGTTPTITDITLNSVLTSVGHSLLVDDVIVFNTTSNGITAGLTYFVYQVLSPNTFTISETIAGPAINTLVNGTGLTLTSRANSGVGATLVNAGAQAALVIDGVSVVATDRVLIRDQVTGYWNGVYVVNDPGSPTTNWVLERATDANKFGTQSPNALGGGDYFYVTEGLIGIGESYVITNVGDFIIGTDTIVFTLFSASPAYYGTNPISVVGQNIQLTGIVDALHGGTGTGTVAVGDLLYGSATNVWSKLPLGVAYKSLIVNASGTNVEWNAIPLNQSAAVSGQLAVANGGTGASTLTGILIGNGTSAITDITGTANQLLRRNSSNTAYEFFTPSYVTYSSFSAVSPLSYNGAGQYSIQVANASQDGYLSSTDWSTFNGKQAQINGTGFVKASGTTISYDNSTYYLASNPSAYIALTALSGGTGISYNNLTGVITNSAPDQTVVLNSGTGISTTGTYPNFTITNTAPDQIVSLSSGTGISVTGTYPGFTITNTAPDQVVALTQGGTTTITGTYPNFTISSSDQYVGTVTSVSGTGTVSGLTLSGTVTSSGSLTLGGSLTLTSLQITTGLGYTPYNATNPSGYLNYNIYTANSSLSSDRTVTGAGKFLKFDSMNGVQIVSTGFNNEALKLTSTEPYLNIVAAGASNSASLFLSPSTSAQNATIQNRTGGGIEFYTGGTPSVLYMVLQSTGQLKLNAYTSTSSFSGTAAGYLAFDASGNVLTVATPTTGITTLNTLTAATQTFAVGTAGTDFAITSTGTTHTFNIPDASATARGLVNTGNQSFAGSKTFSGSINIANTSMSTTFFSSGAETWGGISLTSVSRQYRFNYASTQTLPASGSGSMSYTFFGHTISGSSGATYPLVAGVAVRAGVLNTATSTFTNYATFYIEGAATGTGVITNNYSAWIDSGNVRIDDKLLIGTGTDAGAYSLQVTGQMRLNSYTTTTSYTGTAVGYLGFDASGNILTVAAGGGSGTVTSIATSGPITGGTITTSGTIGITQSTTSTDGYLSSTDWNTFNNKIDYNIYTQDGTLTGNRTMSSGGFTLTLNPQTAVVTTLVASVGASSYSILGQNAISYASGFSSSNIGATYGGSGGISLQTFAGNATFANANLAAAHVSVNSIDFSSAGSTITMTQSTAPGIRAMAAHIAQLQYGRSNSATISHLAVQQNLGIYMPTGTGTLTITNGYSLLINPLDDYGAAGLTFTNRWGIYQAGPSDNNYFAGQVLIGSTATAGDLLNIGAGTATAAPINVTVSGAVLKTSASIGDMEIDSNGILYYTHNNLNRGVVDAEQFIMPTATYTLTSQTAAQKLFNTPTNGALSVKAATTYYFECLINVTSISNTSGSFGFAIGGTATLTSIQWNSVAIKTSTPTTAIAPNITMNTTAANTALNIASAGTVGHAMIRGVIRINAAGTIIPQISLTVANAGIVQPNSYFKVVPIGTNAVTSVGNWS